MTTLREAAQQMLEAIEKGGVVVPAHLPAIEALRTAVLYPGTEYEQGFIDGMSEQARRSVDRFVNAMTKTKEGAA